MPCSYFKAVWGFILIVGLAPTVLQRLLRAFMAATSLLAPGTWSLSGEAQWRPGAVEGGEVRSGAPSLLWPPERCLRPASDPGLVGG